MTRITRAAAALATGGIALLAVVAAPAAQAADVPYDDFSADGSVGLCDAQGKPVRSGSVYDKPFVWRAVSSTRAPAGYDGAGSKATLVIFQPRKKTYPNLWNGDIMTAASTYTNPDAPMAAATKLDFSLAEYMLNYKPLLDGMLQLRIYFGAEHKATWTESYPTTDIRVTGDRWEVVRGDSVDCSQGAAKSGETVTKAPKPGPHETPIVAPSTPAPAGQGAGAGASAPGAAPGATPGPGSTEGPGAEQPGSVPVAASGSTAGGSAAPAGSARTAVLGAVVLLLAALAGGAWWWQRRQGGARG